MYIWCRRTWSALVQVIAFYLTLPNHYLNRCQLISRDVLWHSLERKFSENANYSNFSYEFENYHIYITANAPRGQSVKLEIEIYTTWVAVAGRWPKMSLLGKPWWQKQLGSGHRIVHPIIYVHCFVVFCGRYITVTCRYNAVQFIEMLHTALHWLQQNMSQTDTPHLALAGELWGVCCEEIGENWSRYNGTALYWVKHDSYVLLN